MEDELSSFDALMKFSNKDANYIVSSISNSINDILNSELDEDDIRWLLNCFFFGLKKGEKEVVSEVIQFYTNKINHIFDNLNDLTEREIDFLMIFFDHLRCAFDNTKFGIEEYGYFIVNFNSIPRKRFKLPQKAFNSLWDLLIAADKWINKQNSSEKNVWSFSEITSLTLISCFLLFYNSDNFEEYNQKFKILMKLRFYKNTFNSAFRLYYREYIFFILSNNDEKLKKENNNYYLTEIIDKEFSKSEKQELFSIIIESWKENYWYKDIKICNTMIQKIKTSYLKWFSIDEKNEHPSFHPIFELLKLHESYNDKELVNICLTVINNVISMPEGKENTLFYYLPVYSYDFIMKNHIFSQEIAEKLALMFQRITNPDEDIITHLIYLRNYLNFGYENTLTSLMSKKSTFNIDIYNLFSLLILNRSNFYNIVSKLIKENEIIFNHVFLISCFATIVSKNFANEIKFNFNIWNYFKKEKSNNQFFFLFGLLILIKHSKYFENNNNENKNLDNLLINYNEKLDSDTTDFYEMLKIEFFIGKKSNVHESFLLEEYNFKFITKKMIICVGNDKIAFIHGLGISIFTCEDFNNFTVMNVTTDDLNKNQTTEEEDNYKSLINYDDTNFEKNIEIIDDFVCSDYDKYENQGEITKYNKIPGFSFLCNYGFLSSISSSQIRLIDDSSIENFLNMAQSYSLKIPILHIRKENDHFSYTIHETSLYKRIINNFSKYNSEFCTFSSISDQKEINPSGMNILFALNENQAKININSSEFSRFMMFILITPISSSEFLHVKIAFNQNYFNKLFKADKPIKFYTTLENLSLIIILLSFYVLMVNPNNKESNGIIEFSKLFHSRYKSIEQMFNSATAFDDIDFLYKNI